MRSQALRAVLNVLDLPANVASFHAREGVEKTGFVCGAGFPRAPGFVVNLEALARFQKGESFTFDESANCFAIGDGDISAAALPLDGFLAHKGLAGVGGGGGAGIGLAETQTRPNARPKHFKAALSLCSGGQRQPVVKGRNSIRYRGAVMRRRGVVGGQGLGGRAGAGYRASQ